jgi:hypothetical protein
MARTANKMRGPMNGISAKTQTKKFQWLNLPKLANNRIMLRRSRAQWAEVGNQALVS